MFQMRLPIYSVLLHVNIQVLKCGIIIIIIILLSQLRAPEEAKSYILKQTLIQCTYNNTTFYVGQNQR